MDSENTCVLLNKFNVFDLAENGSFGRLYKVKDLHNLNKIFLLKEFKLKVNEDFKTAKNINSLIKTDSSYLIKYLEIFNDKESKSIYVLIDYFDCQKTLEKKIKNSKIMLKNELIFRWSIQLLKAIEFLHKNEIIHRHIRPSNIYIKSKNILLGDLSLERDPLIMSELSLEAGLGTLNYMAPEVIRNYSNYTKKIDIWSFGCVLYEMIYLKKLFNNRKAKIILDIIKFEEYQLNVSNAHSLFQMVLKKSIVTNPDIRYNASLLIEILQGFTEEFFIELDDAIKEDLKEAENFSNKFEFSKAIECYDKIIDRNFNLAEIHFKKGVCLRGLFKYKEAIESFNQTITLNSNLLSAYNYKGFTFKSMKLYSQAIQMFIQANELNSKPVNIDELLNKGLSLFGLDKPFEAIKFIDKVLNLNSNHTKALNIKGVLLKQMKKYNEAIECYDKVIELDSNYAYAYNNKGILLKELNQNLEAINLFNKAIEKFSYYADAYKNKASCLMNLKQYKEAIDCYDQAINIDKNCSCAFNNKGNCFVYLCKFNESLECYTKSIELEEENVNACLNKAMVLNHINQYSEAIIYFDKVIFIQPDNIEAHLNKKIALNKIN